MQMRRATGETEFVNLENIIIGVNLGYDFCAEHEWGIRGLRSDFGIDANAGYGFVSAKNSVMPEGLKLFEGKTDLLVYLNYWFPGDKNPEQRINERVDDLKKRELSLYGERELACGWSDRDFGIHATRKHRDVLRNLYGAFQTMNGIIVLSGNTNPFANSGLLILDYRKIPDAAKAEAEANDKKGRDEQAFYKKLEQDSGVRELLKTAGKSYLALNIRRLDENNQPLWWLNGGKGPGYYDAWGWYTTDALKQWAEEKGPVVEKAMQEMKEREEAERREAASPRDELVEVTPARIRRSLYTANKPRKKK